MSAIPAVKGKELLRSVKVNVAHAKHWVEKLNIEMPHKVLVRRK